MCTPICHSLRKWAQMFHRRLSAVALVAVGALAVTTMSAPSSVAADAGRAEASSTNRDTGEYWATVIVQLEESSGDHASRYADVKKRIGEAVAQVSPGATIQDVRDYHHVFEGFAIKVPAGSHDYRPEVSAATMAAIKGVQGVKGAFVEGHHEPVTDPDFWDMRDHSTDSSPDLGTASRMTGAAAASQRGQGQVIEVIDVGVDTSHEAFAGSLDAASARLTHQAMTSLTPSLGAGKDGVWVSDKIPFAYDYGDGDTDATTGSASSRASEQGTHVASLATANGASFTGAAPGAQLVVAKVTSDGTYTAYDTALLAALDDAAVIKPDALTVSFSTLEGMSSDSVALYSQVYQRLTEAGVVVNAPAGNDGNSSYGTDPDTGLLGFPAFYSSTLAVASVNEQDAADLGTGAITVSDFSGTGATYDLRLKPEVAAPGGEARAASPGNYYGRQSGTAQASAQVAGISALVRERIATDPAFAALSTAEKNALVGNFVMGTARPIADETRNDGTYYSPRRVGAGMVDAVGATASPVYPTVVGAPDPSRPKADLGDGTNGWTFQVRLTNVSDAAHTYTLGGQALSEDVESMLFTGHSTNWAGAGIDLSFSADSVTVPAASSATVTVTVTPKAEFASYVSDKTPNGTFVDGAVTFTSADGQPNLTVPYMGFYGSWGTPAIFDEQAPNNHEVGYGSTLMSGNLPFGQFNPYEMEDERALDGFHPDRFVITRNGSRTSVTPGTILLRAVPSLTYTVTNEAGATVRTYTCDRADKAFYDDHWRGVHNAEFMSPGCDPSFDSYDADGNELPDGRYTVTIEAATYGPSSATQRTSYSFAVDTVSPVVSNVTVSGEGEERMLSFDVTDASPIAGYGFKTDPDGALTLWRVNSDPSSRSDDGLYHEHFDAKLPSVLSKLGGDPATIQLVVWDWVDNTATSSVSLKAEDTPAPAPTPKAGVWKWDGRGWWYRYEDGSYPADAAVVIDGVTYRFDESGYMRTGWVKDQGAWYYHSSSGAQTTGWVLSGVSWYYLDPATGAMATGWVQVGSTWYYLSPATGAMQTGWLSEGGHWYYLQSGSGAMATGWLRIWGTWYHFADNGQLIS